MTKLASIKIYMTVHRIIKIIYLLLMIGLICSCKPAIIQNNNTFIHKTFKNLPTTELGVRANLKEIEFLSEQIDDPKVSNSGKSLLTFNKTGFDVLNNKASQDSWIIKDFITFCASANKPILDIGAGYGYLSVKLLSLNLKVIANDNAIEHLLYLRKSIANKPEYLQNLYLSYSEFPRSTNFPANSLSAVMMHRVLHFLSPEQIELGFKKIGKWLEPGGKVYIVVMSPTHLQFKNWFLPIYENNWKAGNKWPGINLEVIKALPDQAYNLPKYLHVMDERPLRLALENAGFEIEKSGFISMRHFSNHTTPRDGQEAVGIIATKKMIDKK